MFLHASCLVLLLIASASCDQKYTVVEEFDAARVSNHYQVSFMGIDILNLRSKPVLSLLKESPQNEEGDITSDLFSLDWDKWWTLRGEPVLEVLKQNPHFVAAVCFVVAVIRGLRPATQQEAVDVESLAREVVAALGPRTEETQQRVHDLLAQMEQVTRNQDVIARAFARVIHILRGQREARMGEDDAWDEGEDEEDG